MKEFDKWWNRRGNHIHKLSVSMNNPGGKSHEVMCKLAWKAAFERILDEMNTDEFKDNGELRTFIEAELKDVKPKV